MRRIPSLSVVIANYNSRKYLRASVLSLLAEEIEGLQIIVVDDGSDDDSLQTIRDLPVDCVSLSGRRGQAAAQNVGLARAVGRYFCFFDSDDLLVPGGLTSRLQYLGKVSEANLVAGSIAAIIDGEGKKLGSYQELINPRYVNPPARFERKDLLEGREFPSQLWLLMFRREWMEVIGTLDETLVCSHDNDFVHRILQESAIDFIPQPVAYYRTHTSNLSGKWVNGQWQLSPRARAETLFIHLQYR